MSRQSSVVSADGSWARTTSSVATGQYGPNGPDGRCPTVSTSMGATPTTSPGEPNPGPGSTWHRMNSPWTIPFCLRRGLARHSPTTSSPGGPVLGGDEGLVDGNGLVVGKGLGGDSPQHPHRTSAASSRPVTIRTNRTTPLTCPESETGTLPRSARVPVLSAEPYRLPSHEDRDLASDPAARPG
jgi:hypothetical protein